MIKLQEEIKTDLDVLKSDRHNLESHVEKTEHWIDNVGLWTAYIYNAEVRYTNSVYLNVIQKNTALYYPYRTKNEHYQLDKLSLKPLN